MNKFKDVAGGTLAFIFTLPLALITLGSILYAGFLTLSLLVDVIIFMYDYGFLILFGLVVILLCLFFIWWGIVFIIEKVLMLIENWKDKREVKRIEKFWKEYDEEHRFD